MSIGEIICKQGRKRFKSKVEVERKGWGGEERKRRCKTDGQGVEMKENKERKKEKERKGICRKVGER